MGARKFMVENKDEFDFEVISRDSGVLDNRVGRNHPLKRVPFERVSMKSVMTWLLSHPDVNLTEEQFDNIKNTIEKNNYGVSHNLEKHKYEIPESYEHAQELKNAHKLPKSKVVKRFGKLVKGGAPVLLVGLVAPLVYSKLNEYAEERNISFGQAAMELGLDFTEDDLKALAADVGLDLAVSLTPVGALKKAWDVLGNIDDIVAVTQLYGEAYPDNQVIQELAEVARTVESSEAFEAYLYGRDALTGAVTSVIDGNQEDGKIAEALAGLRASLQDGGAVVDAANRDATQAELAETASFEVRKRIAEGQSLFAAAPAASVKTPLTAPRPDVAVLVPGVDLKGPEDAPLFGDPLAFFAEQRCGMNLRQRGTGAGT